METNELSILELMKQRDILDTLINEKKKELEKEGREAQKKLVPKYKLIQISRFQVGDSGSLKELKVSYVYRFVAELINKDEFDQHLETYRSITNAPDEQLRSVEYFWVPVAVIDEDTIGVIGHTGGGRLMFKDYVSVSLDEWIELTTKGVLIDRILNDNLIPNSDISFYI